MMVRTSVVVKASFTVILIYNVSFLICDMFHVKVSYLNNAIKMACFAFADDFTMHSLHLQKHSMLRHNIGNKFNLIKRTERKRKQLYYSE